MKKLTIIIIGLLLIGIVGAVTFTNIIKDVDKPTYDYLKAKSDSKDNPKVDIKSLGCDEKYCYFHANLTNIIDSSMKINRYYEKDKKIIEYTESELRTMITEKVWVRVESHVKDELNPTSKDEKDLDVVLELR